MFIVVGKSVYKITQDSAMERLRSTIEKKLRYVYSDDILNEIVNEIMKYVFCRGITATQKQYEIDYFKPIYNGPEVKEIANVFDYTLEDLRCGHYCFGYPVIVQKDKKKYVVKRMDYVEETLIKGLQEISGLEKECENIANEITKKMISDSVFTVCLRRNNDISFYLFEADGSCKKINNFDVTELYKNIMSYFPNLEAISKRVRELANLIHNDLCFDIIWRKSEITNRLEVNEKGQSIYEVYVDGIRGFLNASTKKCRSELILIDAKELEKGKDNNAEDMPVLYKGYEIADCALEDEVFKYTIREEEIPVITSVRYCYHKSMSSTDTSYQFFRLHVIKGNKSDDVIIRCDSNEFEDFQGYISLKLN
jgi:hypothetical protein